MAGPSWGLGVRHCHEVDVVRRSCAHAQQYPLNLPLQIRCLSAMHSLRDELRRSRCRAETSTHIVTPVPVGHCWWLSGATRPRTLVVCFDEPYDRRPTTGEELGGMFLCHGVEHDCRVPVDNPVVIRCSIATAVPKGVLTGA